MGWARGWVVGGEPSARGRTDVSSLHSLPLSYPRLLGGAFAVTSLVLLLLLLLRVVAARRRFVTRRRRCRIGIAVAVGSRETAPTPPL